VRSIPEAIEDLQRLGIEVNLAPGTTATTKHVTYSSDPGLKEPVSETRDITYTVYHVPDNQVERFLRYCAALDESHKVEQLAPGYISGTLTVQEAAETGQRAVLPFIVDDISRRRFFVLQPEDYIPEPASHMILLYMLGMLARYSPDIWVRQLDSNTAVVEIMSTLLHSVHRKFPNQILDQLTGCVHEFHP
jgi:hypothetical protein